MLTIDKKGHFGDSFVPGDLPTTSSDKLYLPYFSMRVACGLFGIADDFIEKYQSLDARFVKNRSSTFFFEATGESMSPTILPGEILVVDRSLENYHGKVCIVSHEGSLICKRVLVYADHVVLQSDNPKFKSVRVSEASNSLVWGVVIAKAGEVR